ncbi:hypothetical protein C5613_40830 [Rhodococcus opacus]|uniref:Uncharacterized protein n=1 Tax=Rhodococcus opacus TaxID=37919 RepID=A0A2S8IJE6_RHOOP|nr:hypothetical protein C5613_40830 [Rhodococcus opacus]
MWDGTTTRVGGSVDGACGDAVTGTSSDTPRSRAGILDADRRGSHERRRSDHMRRVGAGGDTVVPPGWWDATDRVDPGLGEVPVVHRA